MRTIVKSHQGANVIQNSGVTTVQTVLPEIFRTVVVRVKTIIMVLAAISCVSSQMLQMRMAPNTETQEACSTILWEILACVSTTGVSSAGKDVRDLIVSTCAIPVCMGPVIWRMVAATVLTGIMALSARIPVQTAAVVKTECVRKMESANVSLGLLVLIAVWSVV